MFLFYIPEFGPLSEIRLPMLQFVSPSEIETKQVNAEPWIGNVDWQIHLIAKCHTNCKTGISFFTPQWDLRVVSPPKVPTEEMHSSRRSPTSIVV